MCSDKIKAIVVVVLIGGYVWLLVNTRFIAWPEMLVWPYLTQHGFDYYTNIVAVYPPLLLRILEWVASWGWSLTSLQLVTWIVLGMSMLATSYTVYKVTKSWLKTAVGLVFFGLWQIRWEGNGIWFDHLLALWWILVFTALYKRKMLAASGLAALALLTKQTAVYMLMPVIITNRVNSSGKRWIGDSIKWLLLTILFTLVGIWLLAPKGNLYTFWHTVITVGVLHLPRHADQIQWPTVKQSLIASMPYLTACLFGWVLNRRKKLKSLNLTLLTWTVFGSLGAFTRFELFHLQPALPFLGLLVATNWKLRVKAKTTIEVWRGIGVVGLVILNIAVMVHFVLNNVNQSPRFMEADLLEFAAIVKSRTVNKSVYSYNTWDHFYYLADQPPELDLIYPNVPMFLDYDELQNKTVKLITQDWPDLIITQKQTYVAREIQGVVEANYRLVWEQGAYQLWELKH